MKKVTISFFITVLFLVMSFGNTVSANSSYIVTRDWWSHFWSRTTITKFQPRTPQEETQDQQTEPEPNQSTEQRTESEDQATQYTGRFTWMFTGSSNSGTNANDRTSTSSRSDHFQTEKPKSITNSQVEQFFFDKIQDERKERGLAHLEYSEALSEVARKKSQDMVINDYFDHQSPTYGSPGEMVRTEGISFRLVKENIAVAGNAKTAHAQLMASSPHRSAILGRNYTHVGIGVVETERGGVMVTQLFIQKR